MVDFLTGRIGLSPAAPTQPTQTREAARPRLAVAMEAPVSATTLAVLSRARAASRTRIPHQGLMPVSAVLAEAGLTHETPGIHK